MAPQPNSDDSTWSQELADAKKAHELRRFNETFKGIVAQESSSARSLFPFILSKLRQFSIERLYDETAILQEVYYRTVSKIHQGREITNHHGWIRSVSLNYIRELSRTHRRNLSLDGPMPELEAPSSVGESFLSDEMHKLQRAFQDLTSEDQLLLTLRTVHNYSWQEIREVWIEEGYPPLELPALRKRKERALARLRRVYHTL